MQCSTLPHVWTQTPRPTCSAASEIQSDSKYWHWSQNGASPRPHTQPRSLQEHRAERRLHNYPGTAWLTPRLESNYSRSFEIRLLIFSLKLRDDDDGGGDCGNSEPGHSWCCAGASARPYASSRASRASSWWCCLFQKKKFKKPQSTLPDYRRQALGSNRMSRNYDISMNIVQSGGRDDKCYCSKGRSGIRGSWNPIFRINICCWCWEFMEDICDTMKSIMYSAYVTMKGPFERVYVSSNPIWSPLKTQAEKPPLTPWWVSTPSNTGYFFSFLFFDSNTESDPPDLPYTTPTTSDAWRGGWRIGKPMDQTKIWNKKKVRKHDRAFQGRFLTRTNK